MNYGYIRQPANVYMRGFTATPEEIKWARKHKSIGLYSYQTHGIYKDGVPMIKWNFSKKEDAVLFALKFK